MKDPAETIAAYGLVLTVLEDLLGRRPFAHNNEVLHGSEGFKCHHPVQSMLHVLDLLPAGPEQGGQVLIEFRPGGTPIAAEARDRGGHGTRVYLLHAVFLFGVANCLRGQIYVFVEGIVKLVDRCRRLINVEPSSVGNEPVLWHTSTRMPSWW